MKIVAEKAYFWPHELTRSKRPLDTLDWTGWDVVDTGGGGHLGVLELGSTVDHCTASNAWGMEKCLPAVCHETIVQVALCTFCLFYFFGKGCARSRDLFLFRGNRCERWTQKKIEETELQFWQPAMPIGKSRRFLLKVLIQLFYVTGTAELSWKFVKWVIIADWISYSMSKLIHLTIIVS